jgi:Protein of unknown function (DUF1659).
MAVTATRVTTEMILVIENGAGASGQTFSKSRIYKYVKPDATIDDIYEVAQDIASLQTKNVLAVQTRNTDELEEA